MARKLVLPSQYTLNEITRSILRHSWVALMKVSVVKIASSVSVFISLALGGLCSVSMAGEDVLQVVASPISSDLVRSIGNAAGIQSVAVTEMNSIAAFNQMCHHMEHPISSIVVSAMSIPGSVAEECADEGIEELSEVSLGFMTLVLVQKSSDPPMGLSDKVLFEALAAQVPDEETLHTSKASSWVDVDSKLPNLAIKVILAPRDGRSRAVFEDEALVGGCRQFRVIQNIFDAASRVRVCVKLREGAVQEVDDVQERIKVLRDAAPGAVALFPISVAEQNRDWMRIIPFNGFMPTAEAINAEDYNLTVPVFAYVRPADLASDGPVQKWMKEALSETAIGESGYGKNFGLVELPVSVREWQRRELFQ